MPLEITRDQILDIWKSEQAERKRRQQGLDYYAGAQAILGKAGTRKDGRSFSKIVMPWTAILVDRQVGFNLGKPINWTTPDDAEDTNEQALQAYKRLSVRNEIEALDAEAFRDALLCGFGVEVHSYDGAEIEITRYPPTQWAFIEDAEQDVQAAIRCLYMPQWTVVDGKPLVDGETHWWVYDDAAIAHYKQKGGGRNQPLQDKIEEVETIPHEYQQLPVVRFQVNESLTPWIDDAFIGLQDAYNETLSNHIDDFQADVDSFLAFHGVSDSVILEVDAESGMTQWQRMKQEGAVAFPDKDSGAEYITRALNESKMQYTENLIRRAIHDAGQAPDLSEIVGATGATSGIALKLKFQAIQESSEGFSKYVRKTMSRRVELLNRIWAATNQPTLDDWDISLSVSLPANETEIWTSIESLEPLLSRIDRARLVPSITDPDQAIANKEREEAEQGAAQGAERGAGAGLGAVGENAADLAARSRTQDELIERSTGSMQTALTARLRGAGVRLSKAEMGKVIERLAPLVK